MNESEAPPPELLSFYDDERADPPLETRARVALRARLAATFAHEPSLEQTRDTKPRGEPARATAREPIVAAPKAGRRKGNMNLFDKRIVGAATLTTAALGLLVVTVYNRQGESPSKQRQPLLAPAPTVAPVRASPAARRLLPPVAPVTSADLAITAGESAWIHVPSGAVDIEIQSNCDADVELAVVARVLMVRGQRADPAALETETSEKVIAGTRSVDGHATAFHLAPGDDLRNSMYSYTSRCAGQPLSRGNIVLGRGDVTEPIALLSNARVYHNTQIVGHGVHVFGTVLPGARVSVGSDTLTLQPADPVRGDLPIYSSFATDVSGSLEQPPSRDMPHVAPAVSVRVDDTKGTHFYVVRPSGTRDEVERPLP
jgi:hypothetical protein